MANKCEIDPSFTKGKYGKPASYEKPPCKTWRTDVVQGITSAHCVEVCDTYYTCPRYEFSSKQKGRKNLEYANLSDVDDENGAINALITHRFQFNPFAE